MAKLCHKLAVDEAGQWADSGSLPCNQNRKVCLKIKTLPQASGSEGLCSPSSLYNFHKDHIKTSLLQCLYTHNHRDSQWAGPHRSINTKSHSSQGQRTSIARDQSYFMQSRGDGVTDVFSTILCHLSPQPPSSTVLGTYDMI